MNAIIEIAKRAGREYITPEDVTAAMGEYNPNKVRIDVLEVLSGITGFGAEDSALCAFNALSVDDQAP